jgi:hypothetical protein
LSHGCIVSSTALDFSSSQALQKYESEHNLTSSSSIQLFQFVATLLQQQHKKRQKWCLHCWYQTHLSQSRNLQSPSSHVQDDTLSETIEGLWLVPSASAQQRNRNSSAWYNDEEDIKVYCTLCMLQVQWMLLPKRNPEGVFIQPKRVQRVPEQ